MFVTFGLYSRLLVFVLIGAAVMSFIMCSDAARVNPIIAPEHHRVRPNVLVRRRHHRPCSVGLLPTDTGLPTEINGETETGGNSLDNLLIIDHQSNPPQFTHGSLGYTHNNPDNEQYRARLAKVQSGHGLGGVRSASGVFTGHSQRGGRHFDQKGHFYSSHPVIVKKISPKKDGSHQISGFKPVWDHKCTRNSLFPSQTAGYRTAPPPPPRGHYSGYKETGELPAVAARSPSSGIQSSKFLRFQSHTAPRETSIGESSVASVIKRNPSPERLTSSITDFSRRLDSVSSSEALKHKKVQSYLFEDSRASATAGTGDGGRALSGLRSAAVVPQTQSSTAEQVYSGLSSDFLPRKEPDHANLLHHKADAAPHGAQTQSLTKYQAISSRYPSLRIKSQSHTRLSPVKGKNMGGPTFIERASSHRYGFDKGKDYKFRYANKYPSLSSKYSFGQRGASTTAAPVKVEGTPTDCSSASPGTVIQTAAVSPLRRLTSGGDHRTNTNTDGWFRTYKRIYDLKGFDAQPFEGDKTLRPEPDKSATAQQDLKGFKLADGTAVRENEIKSLLEIAGGAENEGNHSRPRSFLGLQSVSNRSAHSHDNTYWKPTGQHAATGSPGLGEGPNPPGRSQPVAVKAVLLRTYTGNTARGRPVKINGSKVPSGSPLAYLRGNAAIVRLPRRRAGDRAVTYADIFGSASFSGVRVTNQTLIRPTDTDYRPEGTATTETDALSSEDGAETRENSSRGPEADVEDEDEYFSSAENNKTSALFLGTPEGSGGFHTSDVSPTLTGSQTRGEDSSDLDHLRTSTRSVTFTSTELPHPEKK